MNIFSKEKNQMEDFNVNKKFEVKLTSKTIFEIKNGKFYVLADKSFYKDSDNSMSQNDILLVIDLEILLKYGDLKEFDYENEKYGKFLIPRRRCEARHKDFFGGMQVLPDGTVTYFVVEEIPDDDDVNFVQNYYFVVVRKCDSDVFKFRSTTSKGTIMYKSYYKNVVDEIYWDGEFLHAILKNLDGEFYFRTNLDLSENFISEDMVPIHLNQETTKIDVTSNPFNSFIKMGGVPPEVSQKNPIVIYHINDNYEFVHNGKKYQMGYAELFNKYIMAFGNLTKATRLFYVLLYLEGDSETPDQEKTNSIRKKILSKEFEELDDNKKDLMLEEYYENKLKLWKSEKKYSVTKELCSIVGRVENFEAFHNEKTEFINGLKTTFSTSPTVKCLDEDEDVYMVRLDGTFNPGFHFWNKGKCYELKFVGVDQTFSPGFIRASDIYYEKGTFFVRQSIEKKLVIFE